MSVADREADENSLFTGENALPQPMKEILAPCCSAIALPIGCIPAQKLQLTKEVSRVDSTFVAGLGFHFSLTMSLSSHDFPSSLRVYSDRASYTRRNAGNA